MFPFSEIPLQKKAPFHQLYDQIQNPIFSKSDDPFLSNFPSPFFDEHEVLPLNQILLPDFNSKPAPNPNPNPTTTLPSNPIKKQAPRGRRSAAAEPRKRTGKKDRHSKICTAQGIRDRRMRLSLQVARKFFDLQDMLGYDKASKTIEWLFNKSKKAIKDLAKDHIHSTVGVGGNNNINVSICSDGKSESFVSECEVLSGIEENCEIKEDLDEEEEENNDGNGSGSFEKKSSKRAAAVSVCKPKTRESREKARERARSRTEEKMMLMGKQKLGSLEEDYSPILQLHPPPSDAGTIEKLLGPWTSSSSTSDFANTSNFMGFLGNWDVLSNDRMMMASINQLAPSDSDSMAAPAGINPHNFPFFHHQRLLD